MTSPHKPIHLQRFLHTASRAHSYHHHLLLLVCLSSSKRFLMSEYLTLSASEAVSLISWESDSLNLSPMIGLSFKPVFIRVLSSPFQTVFSLSRLFWSLCWMRNWRSPFPRLSSALFHRHLWDLGVMVFAKHPSICMAGLWDKSRYCVSFERAAV